MELDLDEKGVESCAQILIGLMELLRDGTWSSFKPLRVLAGWFACVCRRGVDGKRELLP